MIRKRIERRKHGQVDRTTTWYDPAADQASYHLRCIISEQDVWLRMSSDEAWRVKWELLNLSDFAYHFHGEPVWD